jgi:hypothetical protein
VDKTMKKEDLVKLGLDEATATKVAEASNEELKGFIPKTRFDEVNESKKQLEKDVASRDVQLETLKNSTGDVEVLKKSITDLQTQNATDKANHEALMKKFQIDNAVEKALTGAKAKNIKAVKALLDLEKAELDGENIKGLEDQLKKLQEGEDSKFLFDITPGKQQFKGFKPGESNDKKPGTETQPSSLAEAVKMHFSTNE